MSEGVLVLVRHSVPEIDPSRPAREWPLARGGCKRAEQLAAWLAPYALDLLVSSEERKALQTGAIVAEELGLRLVVTPGLHEQERSGVIGLDGGQFQDGVARMFEHPGERVFGAESAHEARERFTRALDRVLARHPGRNLCVVAHGIVLSLFVAEQEGKDPYALWQRLGLPCVFVLSRSDLRVIEWTPELPSSGG